MDVEAGGEDGGGDRKFEHGCDGAEAVEEEHWKRRSRSKGKIRITIWVEEMVRDRKDAAEEEEDEEQNEKLW